MKRADEKRLKHPLPRDVNGFGDALSRGLVPSVPSSPPTPATGVLLPCASHVATRGLFKFIVFSGLYALFVLGVLKSLALPYGIGIALALVPGAGWFVLMLRTMERPGRRMLDEVLLGYTTFDSSWSDDRRGSEHSWGEAGPPWSHAGVWILDSNFTVRSAPDRRLDPPGFYPSPHRLGKWELWTGVVWSGTYRNDPWIRPGQVGGETT